MSDEYTTHIFPLAELRRAKIDLHFAADEGFTDKPNKLISLEFTVPADEQERIGAYINGELHEYGEIYDRSIDWYGDQDEMWEVFRKLLAQREQEATGKLPVKRAKKVPEGKRGFVICITSGSQACYLSWALGWNRTQRLSEAHLFATAEEAQQHASTTPGAERVVVEVVRGEKRTHILARQEEKGDE
jgi:hypothetical protein